MARESLCDLCHWTGIGIELDIGRLPKFGSLRLSTFQRIVNRAPEHKGTEPEPEPNPLDRTLGSVQARSSFKDVNPKIDV
jgi:hypothetical protein